MCTFFISKGCIVNLNYTKEVCYNLNNVIFKELCQEMDETAKIFQKKGDIELAATLSSIYDTFLNTNSKVRSSEEAAVIKQVCTAEKESQKLLSKLYAYRAPVG